MVEASWCEYWQRLATALESEDGRNTVVELLGDAARRTQKLLTSLALYEECQRLGPRLARNETTRSHDV